MKKVILALALTILSVSAHAQFGGGEVGSSSVKQLHSLTFSGPFSTVPGNWMEIKYNVGGCQVKDRKTTYALELVSLKEQPLRGEIQEVDLQIRIHIKTQTEGMCAMLGRVTAKVELNQLVKDNAAALGIDFNKARTSYNIEFLTPPVTGGATITNF